MNKDRLLDTLKSDEGFTPEAHWDNRQWSIGYGCRSREGATITEPEACDLLVTLMDEAISDFNRIFKGHTQKFNDIRAECFVNLIFNMGPGRPGGDRGLLSFKNTLSFIFNNQEVPWDKVADGLKRSLWFRQVGHSGEGEGRGCRIVRQIATGEE